MEIHHQNWTRFSKTKHFIKNQLVYNQTKLSVSSRGPRLWSKLLDQKRKSLEHENCFKISTKLPLLSLENQIRFFKVSPSEFTNNL